MKTKKTVKVIMDIGAIPGTNSYGHLEMELSPSKCAIFTKMPRKEQLIYSRKIGKLTFDNNKMTKDNYNVILSTSEEELTAVTCPVINIEGKLASGDIKVYLNSEELKEFRALEYSEKIKLLNKRGEIVIDSWEIDTYEIDGCIVIH